MSRDLPWVKLFRSDRRGHKMKRQTYAMKGVLTDLLKATDDDGRVTMEPHEIVAEFGGDIRTLRKAIDGLVAIGAIAKDEDGAILIHASRGIPPAQACSTDAASWHSATGSDSPRENSGLEGVLAENELGRGGEKKSGTYKTTPSSAPPARTRARKASGPSAASPPPKQSARPAGSRPRKTWKERMLPDSQPSSEERALKAGWVWSGVKRDCENALEGYMLCTWPKLEEEILLAMEDGIDADKTIIPAIRACSRKALAGYRGEGAVISAHYFRAVIRNMHAEKLRKGAA